MIFLTVLMLANLGLVSAATADAVIEMYSKD